MRKVEIQSTEVRERRGTSAKNGKPYCIRSQNAYLHPIDGTKGYPEKFELTLDDDQAAFSVGVYELDAGSVVCGRYGLEIRPILRLNKTVTAMPSMAGGSK